MKRLAFVTSEEDPNLIGDDRLAIDPLKKLGFDVASLVWDRDTDWEGRFDALIFRSCWNYHRKFSEFQAWLEIVRRCGKPVFNPVDVALWNLNKKYLLELRDRGVEIPRTEWVPAGTRLSERELNDAVGRIGTDQVVIKPAVSMTGHDTYLVSAQDVSNLSQTLESLPKGDVLIQEFIPEIKTTGEVSLIFFSGEFSHALRKNAAPGEFRIHEEYGGSRTPIRPDASLIAQASDLVKKVGQPMLFSRVDFVERKDKPAALIELEVIDPMLYLGYSDGAPERFAQAIARLF